MLTVRHGVFSALERAFLGELEALKRDKLAVVAVVAPSRRMADRLQRLVAVEAGRSYLNVRFHTFHSLAREINEGALSRRTLSDPLFHDRIVDGLLQEEASAGRAVPRGLAGAYRSSLRDLIDAGVSGASVREALREYFETEAPEDWKVLGSLLDLQERYLGKLEAAGLAHASEQTRSATRRVGAGTSGLERYAAVLYYGFYDLTGVQADFFRAVAAGHPAVTLFYPFIQGHPAFAFAERFFRTQLGAARCEPASGGEPPALAQALDGLFGEDAAPACVAQDRFELVSVSGTRDECWAVAKRILALREGAAPVAWKDIGVVARSLEAYRSALPAVLRENAIPFSMPEGEPLLRHPIAKLALTVLTLRRREFPAAAVLDVAQSPYFLGRGEHVAQWARLLRKTALHSGWIQWQCKVAPWSEKDLAAPKDESGEPLGEPVPAAATGALWEWIQGLERSLRGPEGASWAGMTAHALSILDAVFTVPAHDPGAAAWQGVREELSKLADFDLAFPDPAWDDFLDAAEERLRRAELEAATQTDGVRVLGVMDARGDAFAHLFLIGLSEGAFPRKVEEDPLLSDAVRERLQQPGGYWILPKRSGFGGLDGYGEEKLLFYLTAASARQRLVCVYPRSDDDGKPRLQSLYLRALMRAAGRPVDEGERVERRAFAKLEDLVKASPARLTPNEAAMLLLRDGSDPDTLLSAAGRPSILLSAGLRSLEGLNANGEPGRLDGMTGPLGARKRPYSPSALESFASCPFKYFASRVLRLEQVDEPVERGELAPWFKGKVYHDALRRFYEGQPPAAGWEPALTQAFADALEGLDWKQAGLYPVLWDAQKARMAARLEAFVAWDVETRALESYTPRRFEAELSGTAGGIALAGRADRIDEGPGGIRVVDYKTRGASRKLRDGVKAMRTLQPPLYLALVEASGDPAAGAVFYGIEDVYADGDPAQGFGAQDWLAGRERFFSNIAGLVAWIEAGKFPISPEDDWNGSCAYCPFDRVCRKAHPATRRRATVSLARTALDELRTLPLPKAARKAEDE